MKGFALVPCFCALALSLRADPPTIISQPQDATANVASAADFTVTASNAAAYQWRTNGTPVPDGTNAMLELDNVTTPWNVDVVLTSADNQTANSRTATLTLVPGTVVALAISTFPNGGTSNLVIQLFDHDKPATVENFLHYITSGAYSNMFFDRLVPNFVLQGGGYFVSGTKSKALAVGSISQTYASDGAFPLYVVNEFDSGPLIHNRRGTLAMAKKAGDPDSAQNAFFINLADNMPNSMNGADLDEQNGGFTVFGRVVSDTNVLGFFNSLHKQGGGIFDESDYDPAPQFTDLPVNNSGFFIPVNGNLFYGDFGTNGLPARDTNLPSVRITYIDTNTSDIIVHGVSTDDVAIARNFAVILSGKGTVTATMTGSTNWSADCGVLAAGGWEAQVDTQDGAGNRASFRPGSAVSNVVAVAANFNVPAFPLRVNVNGSGTVTDFAVVYSNALANGFTDTSTCMRNFACASPVHSGPHSISSWATSMVIYSNGLANGFTNIGTAISGLKATAYVHSSPNSLSVFAKSGQSLNLYHANMDAASVFNLAFWINGGKGGQMIQVAGLTNLNGTPTPAGTFAFKVKLLPNTWNLVSIPMSTLGIDATVSTFNGVQFQLAAGGTTNAFYLDDVALVTAQPLTLYHSDLDSGLYNNLTLWANGGAGGGQVLQVSGIVSAGAAGTNTLAALGKNTWTQFTMPLASIGAGNTAHFDGFSLRLSRAGSTNPFYIDDVQLNSRSAGSAPGVVTGAAGIPGYTNMVALTATPNPGSVFVGWSIGTNGGTLSPQLTFTNINGGTVTANFISNNVANGIAVRAPSAGAELADPIVTLAGAVNAALADNAQVTTRVFARNSLALVSPDFTTTPTNGVWSITLPELTPGLYRALAMVTTADGKGAVTYQDFDVLGAMNLTIKGGGNVINAVTGAPLHRGTNFFEIGSYITAMAVPWSGSVFYNWARPDAGQESNNTVFVFKVTPAYSADAPLNLTASFVSNNMSATALQVTSPPAGGTVYNSSFNVTGTSASTVAYVTCQLFQNGQPVIALATATPKNGKWAASLSGAPTGAQTLYVIGHGVQGGTRMITEKINVNLVPTFAGTYDGVFTPTSGAAVNPVRAGRVSLQLSASGAASGSFQFPGAPANYAFTTLFDTTGLTPVFALGGFYFQELGAQFDVPLSGNPGYEMIGVVGQNSWSSSSAAFRRATWLTNGGNPSAGNYTLLFSPQQIVTGIPPGHGYATMAVSNTGGVFVSGVLADGASFSAGTGISAFGALPLEFVPGSYYVPTSLMPGQSIGNGMVVNLENQFLQVTSNILSGYVYWSKAATTTPNYPAAFPQVEQLYVYGTHPAAPTNGPYEFVFYGGTLAATGTVTNTLTYAAASRTFSTSTNVTSIKINANGLISGVFHNPVTKANDAFQGVFLTVNSTNRGGGFFYEPSKTTTGGFDIQAP